MRSHEARFALRTSVVAVHGALVAMALLPAAYADDMGQEPTVAELTRPASTVEVGAANTSKGAFKYGEYNGLEKKGITAIGNVDLRGGGSYDSDDPTRLRITGTDLGLETRSLTAEYGKQGSFRINIGYDELPRYRSDSYQTPYNGAGTNTLTLPAGWLVPTVPRLSSTTANARGLSLPVTQSSGLVAGVPTAPTPAQSAASAAILAADLPAFHQFDLKTKRSRGDFGFSVNLDTQWEIAGSMRHEKKEGYKPMGTVSRMNATTAASDISAVIPDLIDQSTDQYNLSVNFRNDRSFVTAAYYGSVFKNNVKSMSWSDWATGGAVGAGGAPAGTILGTGVVNRMSSAPDNAFHQLSLTGGYNFSSTTKLVASGSYARNTQNDAYISDPTDTVVPAGSLHGLVSTKAFNLKLTSKPVKDLNLTAAYKYDNRDNRTPVNTYQYADAQEAAVASALFPGVSAQNANANRPYSKRVNQVNLDADYKFTAGQWIKAGYDWQKIDRYCNGTWIDCVDAATTKENTLRAEWRTAVIEDVTTRLGYAHSQRRVDNYNENAFLALVPYANAVPAGQAISAYQAMLLTGLNGYGPISGYNGGVFAGAGLTAAQAALFFPVSTSNLTIGNNALNNFAYANNNRISELPGMRRYNMADRNRDKVRTSVNWQATEQLSLQAGLDYNNDDYNNSIYGLKSARSWALNLDGTYAVSENLTVALFYSYEDQRSRSAGNSYTGNNNTANVNGFTAISGGCYATILARNNANKIDPCLNWSSDMRDKVDTLGLSVRQKNLMSGRLDVGGDLVFTRARTDNNATGGNYVNNPLAVAGAPAGTIAAYFIPASALPTVRTDTVELRLNGRYAIDKTSAVRLGYGFAHLKSTDYAYDGMQPGGLAGVLPSMETAPKYNIHTVAAAYIFSF